MEWEIKALKKDLAHIEKNIFELQMEIIILRKTLYKNKIQSCYSYLYSLLFIGFCFIAEKMFFT